MREYIKTGLILMAYCAIAGLSLGLVYQVTKDRIALTEVQEKLGAVEQVLKDESGNYIVTLDQLRSAVAKVDQQVKVIFENAKGKVYSPVYEFDSDLARGLFALLFESDGLFTGDSRAGCKDRGSRNTKEVLPHGSFGSGERCSSRQGRKFVAALR
jgi:hypothetical protein